MELKLVLEAIEKELAIGREARRIGNKGKARVCARRAAGLAIGFWLRDRPGWGTDAISKLRHLHDEASVPLAVREAALRLTTRVAEDFSLPFTHDPLEDARCIVSALLPSPEDRQQ
jgi:hypothetical protein